MIEALFGGYWAAILTTASTLAIAAIGLQITIRSGQFSVLQAALIGLGGYAGGYGAVEFQWPFLATLAAGLLVGAVVGALAAALFSRVSGLLLGIATLAVGELLVIAAYTYFPGGALGYVGIPIVVSAEIAAALLVTVIVVVGLAQRSQRNLALIASGGDPIAASAIGINVFQTRIWAFAFGGGLAGLAGAMNAQHVGLVIPESMGFAFEVVLIAFVIIGGLRTYWGAVLGAFSITVGQEFLRISTLDRFWMLGLLMTVVVLVRPNGVLNRKHLRVSSGHAERGATGRLSLAGRLPVSRGSSKTGDAE